MAKPRRGAGAFARAQAALREHALAKPSATEHFPWGERAIKVNGKVFLFMRGDATALSLSTKLPESHSVALMLPFATPTGYGLGKAGWVSASFEGRNEPPIEMLCAWIDESYQAVAPAKLAAAARDQAPAGAAPSRGAPPAKTRRRAPAKTRPALTAKARSAPTTKARSAPTAKARSAPTAKARSAPTTKARPAPRRPNAPRS